MTHQKIFIAKPRFQSDGLEDFAFFFVLIYSCAWHSQVDFPYIVSFLWFGRVLLNLGFSAVKLANQDANLQRYVIKYRYLLALGLLLETPMHVHMLKSF